MTLAELLAEPDRLAFVLLLALVLGVLAAGAWMARRKEPCPADAPSVTTWPYLIRLELVAALATLLVVSWWAIGLALPLGPPADPTLTPAQAKAPWFFVGVQELLQYFDPWLAGVLVPFLGLLGLAALPYLDRDPEGAGSYRLRPAAMLALGALFALWIAPAGVGLFLRGDNWSWQPLWRAAVPSDEPVTVVLGSLGERLGLGGAGAQVLGGLLCLGPFGLLALSWPLGARHRFARLGALRYLVAGVLLLMVLGVAVKVVLVAGFRVRYLWVTPWFRI